jgi:hypothetical protein
VLVALLLLQRTEPLLDFSIRQWRETPEMRVEDAYKWLFHATLGGEHAVTSEEGPRRWLAREWKTLEKPGPHEREVVPLTPDRKLVRINLRPYRARGGDPEMLLAVFVASARGFHADRTRFSQAWQSLGVRLRSSPIGRLRYAEWLRVDRGCRRLGYPAIDHSTEYERSYRPAYRVVLGDLW